MNLDDKMSPRAKAIAVIDITVLAITAIAASLGFLLANKESNVDNQYDLLFLVLGAIVTLTICAVANLILFFVSAVVSLYETSKRTKRKLLLLGLSHLIAFGCLVVGYSAGFML